MTTERDMQRVQTRAFIDANPTTVTLSPRIRTTLGNGGFKWTTGTPRPPQVVRLVPQTQALLVRTADGVERRVEYILLASWDAQIAKWDVFTHDGDKYEVSELNPSNGYEISAIVTRYLGV